MRTSYFSRAGYHENAIAICRSVPKWFRGERYMPLAPSWALIKEEDTSRYTRLYYATVLDKLDPQKVVEDLLKINDDPVLLCYEKPSEFCHRFIVRDWLVAKLGITVVEL